MTRDYKRHIKTRLCTLNACEYKKTTRKTLIYTVSIQYVKFIGTL